MTVVVESKGNPFLKTMNSTYSLYLEAVSELHVTRGRELFTRIEK